MDDWCPENDGAFRAEMAALHRDASRARIEALTADNEALQARVAVLEEALRNIDALDPEHMLDGCSYDALRGLILRMGEVARAALKETGHD